MKNFLILSLLLTWSIAFSQSHPDIQLDVAFTGFSTPMDLTHAGDGSNRIFVAERAGVIKLIENGTTLTTPFLNISTLVSSAGEGGLLGLAFHPDYSANGYFYVNYTDDDGDTQVSRYSVSGNPNIADAGSALPIINITQPAPNHNGGGVKFGADGYLYIGMGDGGGSNDPSDNGQRLNTLHGKMLRLDVDGGTPYVIPADNPYVGVMGAEPEIWSSGLRNPWRFSFDRQTGDMWIGDVGQAAREEVSFAPGTSSGGENFGWRCYEGTIVKNLTGCGPIGNYTFPVFEYPHVADEPKTVTGGYVYRGQDYPCLDGFYFCAEFYEDTIWTIAPEGAGWSVESHHGLGIDAIVAFGEDEQGELYALNFGGTIYQVKGASNEVSSTPIPSGSYSAFGDLISSGLVEAGSSVTFDASIVRLEPSFEVEANAQFTIINEGCLTP